MAELRADGQRVLVTAGASGIGRAIVDALVEAGARVHVCDVAEPALTALRADQPSVGSTLADVSDEGAVDRLFDDVRGRLGGLDALVNNAGIAGPTAAIEDIDPADWRRCIDIDLTGQFLCARRAVPMLKAAGGGVMVNMSSAAGRFGYAFRTPYSAAKWGVIGLTESLAKELGPHSITVNAILPGIVAGPRIEGVIARSRRAAGPLLSGDGAPVPGEGVAAPDGLGAGGRLDGAVPDLAARPRGVGPVAGRLRQRGGAMT